jgi:predicted CoA-binding protein
VFFGLKKCYIKKKRILNNSIRNRKILILIKTDYSNLVLLQKNNKIMKNKKTLVLGASAKPEKYAYKAITMLVEKGHSVLAIGQNAGEVAGIKIQTKAIPLKNIDTITLYLNPARQKDYYNYLVETKPKRVLFNPGTENPELYQLLELNNIKSEVACTLVLLTTNRY